MHNGLHSRLLLWILAALIPFPSFAQTKDGAFQLGRSNLTARELISLLEKQGNVRFTYKDAVAARLEQPLQLASSTITLQDALNTLRISAGVSNEQNGTFIILGIAGDPVVVKGRVTDAKGNPLPGVTIKIKGTNTGALSGPDGTFTLKAPSAQAILTVSFMGYKSREVRAGTGAANLGIVLQESYTQLGEVQVTATNKANTEAAVLNERKNSGVVQDAISSAQMTKQASITTVQALQRVTAVTVTDDKFVAIRGLGDRSVIATLNGARLSSADPDRSVVPLDIVPAGLLDNITVYKTLSPDRPADASAGIVELKTRSIPDSLTLEFTAQTGFNTNIGINGKYNGFYNDRLGFWGQHVKDHDLPADFLALKDQYPGGLVQIQDMFIQSRNNPALAAESYRISGIMQRFEPVLTTSYKNASPNQVYNIAFGNMYRLKNGHKLGVVLNGSYYQRTEDIYQATRNQYSLFQGIVTGNKNIFNQLSIPNFITPAYPRLGNYLTYKENMGRKTLNYGLLAGLTYRFSARHIVQAQVVGSRGAETQASNLTGSWQNTGMEFPVYNVINQLRMSQRTFDTYNLQGEHKIIDKNWSPRLTYNLSTSRSTQNDPDFRSTNLANLRTIRYADPGGVGIGEDTYAFVTGMVHGVGNDYSSIMVADPNGRQFRKLIERNYNGKADLTQPFKIGGAEQTLKFGFNYLKRERDFTTHILGLPATSLGGGSADLLNQVNGNINELISPKYVGLQDPGTYDEEGKPRVGGFLYQIRKSPNNYTGAYETRAFYGMIDSRFLQNFRFVGGVRFESTDIKTLVDTNNIFVPLNINAVSGITGQSLRYSTLNPRNRYVEDYKPFYSFNLTYTFQDDMNFRLGYSTSLARPEIRELINIYEYDPFQFAVIGGNPDLKNQFTRSFDFRWEWFPQRGEVLSASAFGKIIENQLQRVFFYRSPGNQSTAPEFPLIVFENDPNEGRVYGIELEIRHNLGRYWSPLKPVYFGANAMMAYSEIDKNPARLEAARINDRRSPAKSPVFEQAPYSVNAYIDFEHPQSGTNVTASFNIVGARLIQVQMDGTPDLYDRPVPVLDLVFSKHLGKRWLVRGFGKNILNPDFKQVYTNPGNNGKYHGTTYIYRQYKKGTEVSLGITYKLF